ncbi:sensor histidine kinase [Microbacterium sp. ZW T5_56]|uniref:sensor histidine kinase n=1 Tax=Microbacterium sp. ZW T5_56 TaxID=3378081 RepID=UPI003852C06B
MTQMMQSPPLTSPSTPTERRGYLELWRRAPGTFVAIAGTFGLGMGTIVALFGLFFTGAALTILGVGLVLMAFSLIVARNLGQVHVRMLRRSGLPTIPEPYRAHAQSRISSWSAAREELRSTHDWAALVHGLIVSFVLSTVSFCVALPWVALAILGPLTPLWEPFSGVGNRAWAAQLIENVPFLSGWSPSAVVMIVLATAGLIALATLPLVLRGLVRMQWSAARAMLGPWAGDDLQAQIDDEREARQAALHAEDSDLRRLERDLHDGPQQRLIRLQMDLGLLERRAKSGDADAAAELAARARAGAQETLAELRALSAGVAPPLLQDRGFAAAVESLAEVAGIPVSLELDRSIDDLLSSEAARSLYFVTAELLTNVVKHADAGRAAVSVARTGDSVVLRVTDDGIGGAVVRSAHGLAGLQERLRGLRGQLEIEPATSGTAIRVTVPVTAFAAR